MAIRLEFGSHSRSEEVEPLTMSEETLLENVQPAKCHRRGVAAAGFILVIGALLLLGMIVLNLRVTASAATEDEGNKVLNLNGILTSQTAVTKVAVALIPNCSHSHAGNCNVSSKDSIPAVQARVKTNVQQLAAWGRTLPGISDFNGTVFYPFSGTDILTVVPLFPKARSIVMAALHKVGDCQATHWSGQELKSRMEAIAATIWNFGAFAYFSTLDMEVHFDRTGLGVSAFLLASLYLAGQDPVSIECGPDLDYLGNASGLASGNAVRILYRPRLQSSSDLSAPRELIYAHRDLLTPSAELSQFLQWVQAQAPIATIMKATGYIIRRSVDLGINGRPGAALDSRPLQHLILNASAIILQDDTGLRASCLDNWQKSFFGTYIGPAQLRETPVDVSTDYDDGIHHLACSGAIKSKPLPVQFGYPGAFPIGICPTWYNHSCPGISGDPGPLHMAVSSSGFALVAHRLT